MFVLNIQHYLLILFAVILEAFPISSSTHLYLLKNLFIQSGSETDLINSIEYVMHGAIVVVVGVFFFNRWFFILKKMYRARLILMKIFMLGIITEIMTLVGFFSFWVHEINFSYSYGFFITTVVLLSLPWLIDRPHNETWNIKNAVIIGLAQAFAFLPGISRFAITFCAARFCGLSNKKSFELSFLIEVPILFAASAKGIHELYQVDALSLILTPTFIITTVISMILMYAALVCVQLLINKERFWLFGCYTLVLALAT